MIETALLPLDLLTPGYEPSPGEVQHYRAVMQSEIKRGFKEIFSDEEIKWFYKSGKRRLRVIPLTLKQANDAVASLHRHHKPVVGHRFSIGVEDEDGRLRGAAIIGRPVSRELDQYRIAEVTRLVTDGCENACSALYGAAARIASEMGFDKIQTYILEEEPGSSLRAAGWEFEVSTTGGDWNHSKKNNGTRRTDQPMGPKQRWARVLHQEKSAA